MDCCLKFPNFEMLPALTATTKQKATKLIWHNPGRAEWEEISRKVDSMTEIIWNTTFNQGFR